MPRDPKITEARELLEEALTIVKESHQDEIDRKHYGDEESTCSTCDWIKRATTYREET